MKKDVIRVSIGSTVLLGIYSLTVFLIPFHKTAVYWISFSATLLAFVVVAVAVYLAFFRRPGAKSRFYGFPIARIGVIYGTVQLVIGLFFMALSRWVPVSLVVLVYAIMLGATIIGLISVEAVENNIQIMDDKLKKDVSFMRRMQSEANQLMANYSHPALTRLAESLRYSDPVSAEALSEIEQELSELMKVLQQAVVDCDPDVIVQLCEKAESVLNERNRMCKLNKTY